MVKKKSANGGCLGSRRQRRTRYSAKSHGELKASDEPWVSEWGNPAVEIRSSMTEYIGYRSELRELKHLST